MQGNRIHHELKELIEDKSGKRRDNLVITGMSEVLITINIVLVLHASQSLKLGRLYVGSMNVRLRVHAYNNGVWVALCIASFVAHNGKR